MHRFFIPKEWVENDKVTISGETARQISRVLRLKPADHIIALDKTGWEYELEIEQINSQVQGKIVDRRRGQGEPQTNITLYQALLKADKMEFVLQKCVEMGVSDFVPFLSERCVVKKPSEIKIERWQNIIREAAEQARRSLIPALHPAISLQQACATANQPSILFWEGEQSTGLSPTLRSPPFKNAKAISFFIGPEGGFSESEVACAIEHDIVPVSMGRRILRGETAGLVAVSAIMYEKGEMG